MKLLEEAQLQSPSEDVQSCLTGNHLFVRRWNDFCPEDFSVMTKGNIGLLDLSLGEKAESSLGDEPSFSMSRMSLRSACESTMS